MSELRYIELVTRIAVALTHLSLMWQASVASQAPPSSASEPELMEFKQALPDGSSRSLEKTEASMVAKGNNALVRYTLYSKFKFIYQINGEKSPVRLGQPGAYKFSVRLRASDDPGKVLQFFKVDGIKGKRFLAPPVQNKKSDNERPFVSEGAGALVSIGVGRLEPGEYCLGLGYSNEGFCFGIDPAEK